MSSEARETGVYAFGSFRLDAAVRRLEKDGLPVTLTAKLFDILLLLVSRGGGLVTKGELIAEIWSDRVVEENNLTVSISALRKALGETHDQRRQYIETVPKYGYRFVAPVRRASEESAALAEEAPRDASAIRSLAVLPLLNAAGDPELDYLTDGITEGVINTLSGVPQLRVMARSTVFRYKGAGVDPRGVGASLGVRAVLVGELRRVGEGIEVAAELVDVRDGSQLWGGQYRRRLSGTYALQEEIAREISEKLFIKLTPGESERLSRGDTEDWEVCRETLVLHPNLSDAHSMISHALVKLGRAEEAVEAALRAHELSSNSVEGLATLGYIYGVAGRRAQAFEVLAELHRLSQHKYVPHHMSAMVYQGLGDVDNTLVRLEKAFDEKSYYMAALATLPIFEELHADARFQSLLERIGFPARLSEDHT